MSTDENKRLAIRITADQFFAERLRITSNLAGKLQGRSAQTLQVHLQYAEFLAQQNDAPTPTKLFFSSNKNVSH